MDIYKERIKPLFDSSGMTDKELEAHFSLPRSAIYNWGNKGYKSYTRYIPQIAAHFHVSTDYLLGNTDDPRPVAELTGDGQKEKPAPPEGSELKMLTPDRYRELFKEMSSDELLSLISEATDELKERG